MPKDNRDGTVDRQSTLSAMEAAESALRQIATLTGREPQGIVSLEPAQDGWIVGVETVEDRRIPSTTDVRGKGDTGEGQR